MNEREADRERQTLIEGIFLGGRGEVDHLVVNEARVVGLDLLQVEI
jgi:hypothetical protein